MRRLIVMSGLLLIFLAGCRLGNPDWAALYATKTEQSVTDLNETALNKPYRDRGNLTRVSWAKFKHDGFVLLGLPAHGNSPQDVVDRTISLTEEEWKRHCERAIEQIPETEVHGWNWSTGDVVGNTFEARPQLEPLEFGVPLTLPDPDAPYCEFVFLPDGWELRIVQRQQMIHATN